jgi:hypothetical protein
MGEPRRIVVFRFDRDPLVCRSRIALLRAMNPDVEVHGLHGGGPRGRGRVYRLGGRRFLGLDSLHVSPRDGRWNWKNGDLALAEWFRSVGRGLDFDVAHLVEWDLVILASLAQAYAGVPEGSVGLTCLTPVSQLTGRWEWLQRPEGMGEWERLLDHARETTGHGDEPLACLGVGPCFPRAFLAAYSSLGMPELCHDELRLPLATQMLGFPLTDTGFRRGWDNRGEDRVFNVGSGSVDVATMEGELGLRGGRRVFHPVRDPVPARLRRLAAAAP